MATHGDTTYDLSPVVGDYDLDFWQHQGVAFVRQAIGSGAVQRVFEAPINAERLGPPVKRPGKVVCIGMNYVDHVAEAEAAFPTEPVVFMKANNTVVGPDDDVLIPPGSTKMDYEVELAVVIGDICRYLPDEASAVQAIAGYTVSNDVSERSYQLERGGQWVKGKSSETFNPLGPYIVTSDEIPDIQNLTLELAVNGEVRQSSNTDQMIFSVKHIVWYLSQFMVLEPGDVINTGTPHGVALGAEPSRYLHPGDRVQVAISGLGSQDQTCRQTVLVDR